MFLATTILCPALSYLHRYACSIKRLNYVRDAPFFMEPLIEDYPRKYNRSLLTIITFGNKF